MDGINRNTSSLYYRGNRDDNAAQENNAVPQSSLPETDQRRPPTMAMRNPRPAAWLQQQIQESLRQGGNLARRVAHGVGGIVQNPTTPIILGAAGIGQFIGARAALALHNDAASGGQWQQANTYANMASFLANSGGRTLSMGLILRLAQSVFSGMHANAHLQNENYLAGRPIAEVVGEIRGHRASSSSASASRSFDWTQAGLFVDRSGIDRTADVSHLLNRILQHSIKDARGTISSARAALVNNLLDSFEKDPDYRSGLADQVLEINATCIDRANVGINIFMRQLDTHGLKEKTPKDALLHIIGGAVMAAAYKELRHLPELKVADYQAIYRLAAEELRKKIPDFQIKIEDLKYDNDRVLSKTEIKAIAAKAVKMKAVKMFDDPMQIAQCLLDFPMAKEQMEVRFATELQAVNMKIDEQRINEYSQSTQAEEGSSLAEDGRLAVALNEKFELKRQEAIKECYAQLIADASLFTS